MTEIGQIYKCEVCGNVVSVLFAGQGELVCCDEKMKLMDEKTVAQEGKEKHIPVIEKTEKGVKVKVGSIPHPMEEKHYITTIQLLEGDKVVLEKHLSAGDEPVAEFCVPDGDYRAREYCNVHGLWISD